MQSILVMDSKNDAALKQFYSRSKQARGQHPISYRNKNAFYGDVKSGLDTAYLTRVGVSYAPSRRDMMARRRQSNFVGDSA